MDEVDDIIAAWQRERPDTDVSPMEVMSRITRLGKHLDRVRKQSFEAHGLESWEWDVLAALRRNGPPFELSAGDLVKATMVTSGTMTNRVDRLEQRGLVQRRPAPADRRGVLVQLTDDGRQLVDAALDTLMAHEATLLEGLASDDRAAMAEALRLLTAQLATRR